MLRTISKHLLLICNLLVISGISYAVSTKDTVIKENVKIESGNSFSLGSTQLDDGSDNWRSDGINWDFTSNAAAGKVLTYVSSQVANWDDVDTILTVQKDLVTTAPITGGTDNILPGADSDVTIALTQNAGTDVTADLEEESHCSEHDSADVDCTGETIVFASDSVDPANLAETDFGDFTVLSDSATLDSDVVDAAAIATDAVGTDELDDDANSPTAGDIVVVEVGAASFDYITQNAGTDVTADLEEETHCSEHASTDVSCSGETILVTDDQHNHTGATLSSVDISDDTNLAVSGTLLDLTGDTLSVNEGTLTDNNLCDYESTGTQLECTTNTKAELEDIITDVADFAEADGDVYTNAHDFGGAGSIEIVNNANPTIDAAGEIGIDTTDGQLTWHDGTAQRQIGYEDPVCRTIENLFFGDDNWPFASWNDAVTIQSIWCTCSGDCSTTANISLEDDDGNAMTHTTPTCTAFGTTPTAQTISAGGSLTAREGLAFDVDNTPTAEDTYKICVSWTLDEQ